ncbi:uncharacterized protein LOC134540640 isoform X2 [Bacillus rossius redtenbacheri]|uniref:uncharacterized protein LOC134540640 isoform X2 n=1 Tax=Bacillus rossius redtenbacheri TaxID=93214 RepID=UPI002FDF09CB
MDDSSSENLINFNVSQVRKFLPLVPIPSEAAFVSSMESSPFDRTGGGSSSSDDPYELVLRTAARADQSAEPRGREGSADCLGLPGEAEASEAGPWHQSDSLVQVLAENFTCISDISDPVGANSTSVLSSSAVSADESFRCSVTDAEGRRGNAAPERDISTMVNRKLDSCIQMVMSISCSKPRGEGRASAGNLCGSLADLRPAGREEPASRGRRSLDVSSDGAGKLSWPHGGDGDGRGGSSSADVLNQGFLRGASSEGSSAGGSSLRVPGATGAVSGVLLRRWLGNAEGRVRALSCDADFPGQAAGDARRSSPTLSLRGLDHSGCSSVFSSPLGAPGAAGAEGSSREGSRHSLQDMNLASPEHQLAREAMRVALNISNRAAGNRRDETLDDIEMDLFSSEDDDDEHCNNLQQSERFLLREPAVVPLPLDVDRLSGLSLQRAPVLPAPLLDQGALLARLKQLRAANLRPAPLRAVLPLDSMSKPADVCPVHLAHKTSQSLNCETKCDDSRPLTATIGSDLQEAFVSSSKPQLRRSPAGSASSRSSSQSRCRQSSAGSADSGANPRSQSRAGCRSGLPVPRQSPSSKGSAPLPLPARAPVTSTPVRCEVPGVTPAGGRQFKRQSSVSPQSTRESVARRPRSASVAPVTPMQSVGNRLAAARKAPPTDKVPLQFKRKFVRAAENKENIFPA